jgi:hypothetical protein
MKKYLILIISLLVLVLGLALSQPSSAQGTNRAGLVIQFSDGVVETRCVEFSKQTITGLEVLEQSGLPVLAAFDPSLGAMVCKIQEQGCPVDNCLCQNPPDYWSYWHLNGNSWVYSPAGSSTYQVSDGEVQGWSWGPGNPPPVRTFNEICAAPAADIPTNTQISPTATPAPTDTPIPTHTPELEPTTRPPPTDTQAPPTQSDSQAQVTRSPTATLEPATATPLPTFTTLPTETSDQVLPTDTPAATETPAVTETLPLEQGPYPYPAQPEPEVTSIPATSPPAYPYPIEPVPEIEPTATATVPTPTLMPAYLPPAEDIPAESPFDRFSDAILNARYQLLCAAWLLCGGSISIILVGWLVILLRMWRQ